MNKTLALGAFALALGGCAAGPYYDDAYGYGPNYAPGYYYDYGAPSYYYGPSVGLGYYYYDNDGHRHWHDGDRNWNDRHYNDNRDHGDRGDRGNGSVRPGPGGSESMGSPESYHGESGNEAGMGTSHGGRH